MRPEPVEVSGSARWHLFDFDPDFESATLLRLDEAHYRQASFLDERVLPAARARAEMSVAELASVLQDAPPTPEPRFIFHIGHCGSTLLSRGLDASLRTLPLREPLTLRRLAAQETGPHAELLDMSLRAHRRTFRPGQAAIIKATSTCNALIAPLLGARAGARAVLLHVDLATYLAGLLGRQTPARDLAGHLPARLADWARIDGTPALDPAALSEAERASLAWLTGMHLLLTAAAAAGDRALVLDFEQFLAAPEAGLTRVAGFFGFEADLGSLLSAWPDVAGGYSKQPETPYSAYDRRRIISRGRRERGGEITAGLRWAEEHVDRVPALAPCAHYFG